MAFERIAPNGQTIVFDDGTSEEDVQKYLALEEFQVKGVSPSGKDQVDGLGDLAYDIGVRGAVGGARDAIQSSTNLAEDILEKTGDDDSFWNSAVVFGKNNTANGKFIDFMSRAEMKKHNVGYLGFGKIGVDDGVTLPEVDAPKTLAGDLTKGVSQFYTGWVTGGKVLKGVGVANKLSKAGKFAEMSVKGGVADFIAFDENTGRLVDLIDQKAPSLSNPVFEYLQTDENDGWFEGRMKNALEGFMLGGTLDVAIRGIRYAKNKFRKDNGLKYNKDTFKEDEQYLNNLKEGDLKEAPKDVTNEKFGKEFVSNLQKGIEDGVFARFRIAQDMSLNKKSFDYNTDMLDLNLGFNMRQMKQLDENGLLSVDAWQKATDKLIAEKKIVLTDASVRRSATQLYKNNLEKLEMDTVELEEVIKKAPARIVALNSYLQTMSNGLKHAGLQSIDDKNVQDFVFDVLLPKYRFISETKKSINANVARSQRLASDGLDTKIAVDLDKALKDFDNYKDIKDPKARAELLKRISLAGDNDVTSVLDYIVNNKTINVANEIWINMLLSNPKTHIINMVSNTMNILIRPLERMVGSQMTSRLIEDADKVAKLRQEFAPAVGSYIRMRRHLMDSLRLAKSAFMNEDGIITSRNKLDVPEKSIQKLKMKDGKVIEDFDTTSGKVINTAGKVARISNRFLTAEDEAFKQVVYRANLEEDAYRQAIQKGLSKDKIVATDIATKKPLSEFEAFVIQKFEQGFDEFGKATNKKILREAEEATFTQDLDGIFDSIQKTVNKYPIMKQVLPFVRTPVNIMLNVTDRTGLGFLRKQWRDDFLGRNGARRMAQARGGLATGYGLMLWASMLWKEGMITGAQGQIVGEKSTKSKDLKDLRRNMGVQPYAFRMYDQETGTYKYVQFGRLDPFGAFLGMVADYNTFYDQMTEEEAMRAGSNIMIAIARQGGEVEDYLSGTTKAGIRASALWHSVARNIFSKTYLKGLADFMEAITDDQTGKMARYGRSKLGSFVPNVYTKFMNDEFVRDSKSMMEELQKRSGFGDEVEMKFDFRGKPLKQQGSTALNFVNGVFNPLYYAEQKDDPVAEEILRLGVNMPKLTDRLGGDIDLNLFYSKDGQSAYNRLQQHLRNVRFYGGKSLDQALRDLIASDEYKRLGDPIGVDAFNKDNGGKVRKLKAVIAKYQSEAEEYLKSEANKFYSEKEKTGTFTLKNSIDQVNLNIEKLKTGVQVNTSDMNSLYEWSK